MIFCARATRGLRRPSPGLMARLGVTVGGRVRKLRAVEDQSAPIPEERTSELGGIILMDDGCRMRAVKASLATPLGRCGTEKALVGRAGGRNSLGTLERRDSC